MIKEKVAKTPVKRRLPSDCIAEPSSPLTNGDHIQNGHCANNVFENGCGKLELPEFEKSSKFEKSPKKSAEKPEPTPSTQATEISELHRIKQVGGQRLTRVRPLFTQADELMVPDEDAILFFAADSRVISRTLRPVWLADPTLTKQADDLEVKPADDLDGIDELRALCLHPALPYFQLFAFSRSARAFQCNYEDGSTVASSQLLFEPISAEEQAELVWGRILSFKSDEHSSSLLVFFYAIKVTQKSQKKKKKQNERVRYDIYSAPVGKLGRFQKLFETDIFSEQRIAFGPENAYVVYIEREKCFLLKLSAKGRKEDEASKPQRVYKRKSNKYYSYFSGIVCSPTEHVLAHSEEDGKIVVRRIDPAEPSQKTVNTLLHWHPLAVTDLLFSQTGSFLYSVGSEGVVVRWNLATLEKNFFARVGYGIRFIASNHNDSSLALTLQNNVLRLIGSHFADLSSAELSTLMYYEQQQFSTGLVYNSRLQALGVNGRPGHLQFFCPANKNESQLRTLDVTNTNYIEPVKGQASIVNIDVDKLASSPCGNWLATFELRDDGATFPELRLKFWRYNGSLYAQEPGRAKFELNTCVQLPHKDRLLDLRFSPNSQFLVTTSLDKCFKVWALEGHGGHSGQINQSWVAVYSGQLNSQQVPSRVAFAEDSSMLALAYDSFVALSSTRDLASIRFLDSIQHSPAERIVGLEFGTKDSSYLLASLSRSALCVWELPRSKLAWQWTCESGEQIVCHTFAASLNKLIVLTSSSQFLVFSLSSGRPLARIPLPSSISASSVESICFFPTQQAPDELFGSSIPCFLTRSKQIYVIENKQLALEQAEQSNIDIDIKNENENENENENSSLEKKHRLTFIDELYRRRRTPVGSGEVDFVQQLSLLSLKNNPSRLVNEMFYNIPAHVLPPIDKIAKQFLSLLQPADEALLLKQPAETAAGSKHFIYPTEKADELAEAQPTSARLYQSAEEEQSNTEDEAGQSADKSLLLYKSRQAGREAESSADLLEHLASAKQFTFDEDYSFLQTAQSEAV